MSRQYEPEPCEYGSMIRWTWYAKQDTDEPHALPAALFGALTGGYPHPTFREYQTREAAMDALARAQGEANQESAP